MPASTVIAELTQEQVQAILVQPLTAASVFLLAAGPRIFDVTAAGPVRIPTLVGMDAPSWHGESEQINEVNATFGEVRLLDGIKSLKSITRFSNELARSSIVALDAALRDRMVLDVASKLDTALIAGTGDPNASGKRTTPLGIINYAGTQQILAAGAPSVDVLLDAGSCERSLGGCRGPARPGSGDPERTKALHRIGEGPVVRARGGVASPATGRGCPTSLISV